MNYRSRCPGGQRETPATPIHVKDLMQFYSQILPFCQESPNRISASCAIKISSFRHACTVSSSLPVLGLRYHRSTCHSGCGMEIISCTVVQSLASIHRNTTMGTGHRHDHAIMSQLWFHRSDHAASWMHGPGRPWKHPAHWWDPCVPAPIVQPSYLRHV